MADFRSKREVLEKQIGHFETQKFDDVLLPTLKQITVFSQMARKKLSDLRFEARKAIMLKVVDTIIADQQQLRVRGAVYLPIQEEQNVKSYSKGRNTKFTFPYLEFRFGLTVPDPRKERFITQRDSLGRIIHSKPPELSI